VSLLWRVLSRAATVVGVDENYENPWIQMLASPKVGGYSRSVSKRAPGGPDTHVPEPALTIQIALRRWRGYSVTEGIVLTKRPSPDIEKVEQSVVPCHT